jgi:hypothetical protein
MGAGVQKNMALTKSLPSETRRDAAHQDIQDKYVRKCFMPVITAESLVRGSYYCVSKHGSLRKRDSRRDGERAVSR